MRPQLPRTHYNDVIMSDSNHQPHYCLLNRLFRRRSKKTSTIRVTGLCARNSPVTGEFPAQMASNAENVSIWWCHHACMSVKQGSSIILVAVFKTACIYTYFYAVTVPATKSEKANRKIHTSCNLCTKYGHCLPQHHKWKQYWYSLVFWGWKISLINGYMLQWTGRSLVQSSVRHKSNCLNQYWLIFHYLKKTTSMIDESKYENINWRRHIWECHMNSYRHFV